MRNLALSLLASCLVGLSSCQAPAPTPSASPSGQASPTPNFTTMGDVPNAPVAEMPAPQNAARVMNYEDEKVLASKIGDYEVHLKPAGENIEVLLLKQGSLDVPGFTTVAASGPRDFEGRVLEVLKMHPEFQHPLLEVLNAATAKNPSPELPLNAQQQQSASLLMKAVSGGSQVQGESKAPDWLEPKK